MRTAPILEDSYYHVFNRGNQKQILFYDAADYSRFLFLLLYLQSPVTFTQINRRVQKFVDTQDFDIKPKDIAEIVATRYVSVLNFCIMPNHFHITVHNVTEEGIEKYMHRVGNAYAKYFNTKYERTGHVFQGTYKANTILDDEQLVYTSAYIHKNPHELTSFANACHQYPWSSYSDYVHQNRWGKLLDHSSISDTFDTPAEYQTYVETSGAKMSNT